MLRVSAIGEIGWKCCFWNENCVSQRARSQCAQFRFLLHIRQTEIVEIRCQQRSREPHIPAAFEVGCSNNSHMVSSSTGTDRPHSAKKYDRQLRIWGAHGQAALESASICLLNCGPTGSETLKNLVLGGIAQFTIVDASRVQPADLGNNFLLHMDSLGGSRALHVTDLLKELNESVRGSFVEEAPEALLEHNPAFFKEFDLVVATQVRPGMPLCAHRRDSWVPSHRRLGYALQLSLPADA